MKLSYELRLLKAALDAVEEGVILLDSELRAGFMTARCGSYGEFPTPWPTASHITRNFSMTFIRPTPTVFQLKSWSLTSRIGLRP